MTPDRRDAEHHGPFTTWQWAVMGAYFVAIVLCVAVGSLAIRADESAHRGAVAICVEVEFLRASRVQAIEAVRAHPRAPETSARLQAAARLGALVKHVEDAVPACRPRTARRHPRRHPEHAIKGP